MYFILLIIMITSFLKITWPEIARLYSVLPTYYLLAATVRNTTNLLKKITKLSYSELIYENGPRIGVISFFRKLKNPTCTTILKKPLLRFKSRSEKSLLLIKRIFPKPQKRKLLKGNWKFLKKSWKVNVKNANFWREKHLI